MELMRAGKGIRIRFEDVESERDCIHRQQFWSVILTANIHPLQFAMERIKSRNNIRCHRHQRHHSSRSYMRTVSDIVILKKKAASDL